MYGIWRELLLYRFFLIYTNIYKHSWLRVGRTTNQGVGFRNPRLAYSTQVDLADDCLNGHKSQDYAPISWD